MDKNGKEPRSKARAQRPEVRVDEKGKARAQRSVGEKIMACDLMLGDLVWSEIGGSIALVESLSEDGVIGTRNKSFRIPSDEVRAVKITDAALKAMGFKKNVVINGLFYVEDPKEVTVVDVGGGRWEVDVCEGDGKVTDVRYVHELLHVLRMFGLEPGRRW